MARKSIPNRTKAVPAAMKPLKARVIAYHKLSFYSAKHCTNWHMPASEKQIEAEYKDYGLNGRSNRKSALYCVGCKQGSAAADEFMDFLREHGHVYIGGCLQNIVLDMFKDGDDNGLVRGQAVGFFEALERWLVFAAKNGRLNSTGGAA